MATAQTELPIEGKTVKALTLLQLKRTYDLFTGNHGEPVPMDEESQKLKIACKIRAEYAAAQHLSAPAPAPSAPQQPQPAGPGRPQPGSTAAQPQPAGPGKAESRSSLAKLIDTIPNPDRSAAGGASTSGAPGAPGQLVAFTGGASTAQQQRAIMEVIKPKAFNSSAVSRRAAAKWPRPEWHAPWKMYRVVSGHLGWVRSIAFDPGNEWFVTGSADRTIKFWDLASGQLKLTLTGHIEQVTGLAISSRHPYMFSCGLDKTVKCWDLEQNKVIRNYHGHLSGVYSLALHPTLDILMSGGRDSVCRLWDMRTKVQIHCLSGHEQTVCSILAQPTDPQVITGSHDSTIKMWDIRKATTMSTLTYHKKSVRAMAAHPREMAFASASADNIKKFRLPEGEFLHNMLQQQRTIVNCMALNEDGVMATGGDNGSLWFWDWKSGNCFQQGETIAQPGSMDSESGIFAAAFDASGSRLVTCEADKTIKMWREDEDATPETHPINFRPPKDIRRF